MKKSLENLAIMPYISASFYLDGLYQNLVNLFIYLNMKYKI